MLQTETVDHGFDGALVKFAEPSELMLNVVGHATAHPVYGLSKEKTLIVVDNYFFIFFVYLPAAAELFEISSDYFVTDLHEIMDKNILAVGIEKMKCDLAMR